jgi:prepilin peptidase CpaA
MSNFVTAVKTFIADENGVTAIEYGLIAALIGVVMATAADVIGDRLKLAFDFIKNKLPTAYDVIAVAALRVTSPEGFFFSEDAMPIEQYREMALVLLVSIAAVNDLATRLIPNRLLLAGLAGALLLHALVRRTRRCPAVRARRHGRGPGDVPAVLPGARHGRRRRQDDGGGRRLHRPGRCIQIAVLTWCVGGVMALVLVLLRGRLQLALGNIGRWCSAPSRRRVRAATATAPHSSGSLPYGVAIAVGTLMVLVRHYG